MAMVDVDTIAAYRWAGGSSRLAQSESSGTVLHSPNELGELSEWLCHDDSTINIG